MAIKNSFRAGQYLFLLPLAMGLCMFLSACSKSDKLTDIKNTAPSSSAASSPAVSAVPVVPVELQKLDRKLDLPGELEAFQNVPMHAKVEGFVRSIVVDRGSTVKRGQVMLTIACPELKEKEEEAGAKVSGAESAMRQGQENVASQGSKLVEANARLDSDTLTLSRLQQAAQTPGAIAQNDIDTQTKTVEADKARVESLKSEVKAAHALVLSQRQNIAAAKNVVEALGAMRDYLTIRAPFDGVVTERNVHEGSIVAVDSSRSSLPLVRVQQKDTLRLVVAVPEECVAGLKNGADISFSVPAFLGKTFNGKIARLGFALDAKTRTMPVELNVDNSGGELEPGMFATVHWRAARPYATMFVPGSAVATTLKGTFVVVVDRGKCRQVTVTKGQSMGNRVEIVGDIHPGDQVVLKGTDEFKDGQVITTRASTEDDLIKAGSQSAGGGE